MKLNENYPQQEVSGKNFAAAISLQKENLKAVSDVARWTLDSDPMND